jgi:hypothetical protein
MGIAAFDLVLEEMIAHHDQTVFVPKIIELETKVIERESSIRK